MQNRAPAELIRPRVAPGEILGVDVSRYQGAVDWGLAARRGVTFALIKASEGYDVRDSRFVANARGAASAGILWGPYVFWRFSTSPAAHLSALTEQIAAAGVIPTLPVAIDMEDTTVSRPSGTAPAAFAELIRPKWGRPLLYTASWWWVRFGTPQAWASALPLWVADYSGAVSVPSDWSDWAIHQYSSSGDGRYYGASSDAIDLNRFRGTVADLARLYQGPTAPPPAPTPGGIDRALVWADLATEFGTHGVRLNSGSAIQTAILADGRLPVTNEVEVRIGGGKKALGSVGQARGQGQVAYVWLDGKVHRIGQVNLPVDPTEV